MACGGLRQAGLLQIVFPPGSFLCRIAWAAVLTGALIQWLPFEKVRFVNTSYSRQGETGRKWLQPGSLCLVSRKNP